MRISNRNYFNRDVILDANHWISIGEDNMFGPGVYVTDSNHRTGLIRGSTMPRSNWTRCRSVAIAGSGE
jgi:hypothetical protein